MTATALADAVTHLPGLAPSAASLVALARAPTSSWESICIDPAAVLLVARASAKSSRTADRSVGSMLTRHSRLFDVAIRLMDEAPFVPWGNRAVAPVYHAALQYAQVAGFLAEQTRSCDAANAWAAGLVAPLGWFAVCAVSPDHATACLSDPRFNANSTATQRRHWGTDHSAIARRLNRRWRLPPWLSTVTGHLDLPADDAVALGADASIFRIVQLAVLLVQRDGNGLHLTAGDSMTEAAAALGISAGDWSEIEAAADRITAAIPTTSLWEAPSSSPLLRDLLTLAAANRRLSDAPAIHALECEVDHLHRALSEQRVGEDKRLRDQKLASLAEFAAGAGHEINNPLAVISGQAQYLLGEEADPSRQKLLQTIINQTHRIHQILNALMQFARPARPQKQLVDLPLLVRDVTAELTDLAEQRRVRLTCSLPDYPIASYADPRQLHLALECLVRNAIEAAPQEGWAGVRLEAPTPDRVELIVEDSGTGPTEAQQEHLFDPFYSGRQAGRGRGLGLPTAWRLAREHGGDVRFDDLPQGPTRFVLSLPRQPETAAVSGQRCA